MTRAGALAWSLVELFGLALVPFAVAFGCAGFAAAAAALLLARR